MSDDTVTVERPTLPRLGVWGQIGMVVLAVVCWALGATGPFYVACGG